MINRVRAEQYERPAARQHVDERAVLLAPALEDSQRAAVLGPVRRVVQVEQERDLRAPRGPRAAAARTTDRTTDRTTERTSE